MNNPIEIKVYGEPVLREKAKPVEKITDELRNLVPDFVRTMKSEDGVGLAANQIGLAIRMIAVSDGDQDYVLFNPKITSWSMRKIIAEEGCLSLPGLYAEVERSSKVVVKGMQEDGKEVEIVARNIFARAIQHEIDHLNGVLFIDRMKPGTLKKLVKKEGQDEHEYNIIDIVEVRKQFTKLYHQNAKELMFDKKSNAE